MPPSLRVKTAGLPRWAWLGLLAGGIGVGLYLHSRNQSEGEEEETEELPNAAPQTLSSYEGGEQGGGLQALGVAGPTPQATVPVESPYVPEAFPETLGGQGDVIQSLSNGIIESNLASQELAGILAEREPNKEIIREQMVGHAPVRKVHHMPPPRHPKKKAIKKPHGKKKKHKKK